MLKIFPLKSEFSKNVATLFTGTLIAQSLPVLVSPILTRLYSPEDFASFGLFMATVGILSVLATSRFELAIILPEKREDAKHIAGISLLFTLLLFVISSFIIVFFKDSVVEIFLNKRSGNLDNYWLYFIPFSILFFGMYQTFNYWSSRNKTFKLNARSRVFQSGGNVAFSTMFGFMGSGGPGLIMGYVIGQFLGVSSLISKTLRNLSSGKVKAILGRQGLTENLKKYKDFGLVNTPHALVGSIQDQGVVFIINYFFGSILGFYSFAYRVLSAPMGLIGSSMYQVFYQRASSMFNDGLELKNLVMNMYKKLFVFGFPVFFTLYFIAPQLFAFVFGEQWIVAGEIAKILTPWLFLNFLAAPVSCLPLIVGKQKQAFAITLIDICFKYGAIITGGILGNYEFAFAIFSIWGSLLMLFALWWYYKLSMIKKESF